MYVRFLPEWVKSRYRIWDVCSILGKSGNFEGAINGEGKMQYGAIRH